MRNFNGSAFVAFADLCGFKELMRSRENAYSALNRLYNRAYELGKAHPAVDALAVSDCVVAWVAAANNGLDTLLKYAKKLHSHMLERDYLMRTTIACGQFQYQERINLDNLQKDMMYGGAYLEAYRKNDKAEPGSIVILNDDALADPTRFAPAHASLMMRMRANNRGDWEFFWSVRDETEIEDLKRNRTDSYQARFAALVRAYKGNIVRARRPDRRASPA